MTRAVVTICCPECVGAGPVADWSRLDPDCGLCVGCGRIDLDQPAQPPAASPQPDRTDVGADAGRGERR